METVDSFSSLPTTQAIVTTLRWVVPRVALAAAILFLGWVVARILRAVARRLLARWSARQPAMEAGGRWAELVDQGRPGQLLGWAVYWIAILAAVMTATEVLGLSVVTTWLGSVAGYVPRLLAAAILVFAASIGSKLLGQAVVRAATVAGSRYASRLGNLVQVVLTSAAVLMALQQVGVDVSFITTTVLIVLSAVVAGTALAFGLGARTFVSQILAMHYVQKSFQIGERVRVREAEGRIIRFTSTAVILDSEGGETTVPALDLTTHPTVRLPKEA